MISQFISHVGDNASIANDSSFPLLSSMILLPLIGALIITFLPKTQEWISHKLGLVFTSAVFGLAVWMVYDFQAKSSSYQFTENHQWIKELGISYSLGIDGISLFLVALTAFLFPIAILISDSIKDRARSFIAWLLVLQSFVILVFSARDLFLFFVGFELVLIPMYFLIAGFGHGDSKRVALKFFLFTMGGSIFFLAAMFSLAAMNANQTGKWSFAIDVLMKFASSHISTTTSMWLFAGFTIAFAVKVPLFPLHTWLPDAHTEAPTAGSVILAGVLLKLGTYGLIRISIAFFPYAAHRLIWILLAVSVIGIIYGAIVATVQPDLKRLIAYSSIAHLGFVVLGIASLTKQGLSGSIFTMVSHGLTTGALFAIVGMLYERRHTRNIADYSGLMKTVPVLSGAFLIATFASIGLPGFSGFVGEFLSMLGAFISHRYYVAVAATGVIFAALYLLWAYQRVFTGAPKEADEKMKDITPRELMCVIPLLALSLFLGLAPQFMLDRINPSVNKLSEHIAKTSNQKTIDSVENIHHSEAKK
ncbi:MAG: NADH-quinone oxidoreductase subunit M [Acidimicrobiia bacterium]